MQDCRRAKNRRNHDSRFLLWPRPQLGHDAAKDKADGSAGYGGAVITSLLEEELVKMNNL